MSAVARRPLVVEGHSWPRHGYLSPLDPHPGETGHPTRLRGGVVTDPVQVAGIRARIAYYRRPWLVRLWQPRPPSEVYLRARAVEQS